MKKIIAALIAVVMVVSCMSVAFAGTVNSYEMEVREGGDRCRVTLSAAFAEGDILSFYIKLVPAEGSDMTAVTAKAEMYARDKDNTSVRAKYIVGGEVTDVDVYSGKLLVDYAVDCGDGWYYIEGEIQAAATTYELSVNGEYIDGGKIGACVIAGVKLNGTEVASDAVKGYDTGASTATAVEEPVPVVDETEDVENTEDTTDVEETGVVSVAIVAVAAVLGGAVVLKKREF